MNKPIYENFNCNYCQKEVTRVARFNSRIGKVNRYCTVECSRKAMRMVGGIY